MSYGTERAHPLWIESSSFRQAERAQGIDATATTADAIEVQCGLDLGWGV